MGGKLGQGSGKDLQVFTKSSIFTPVVNMDDFVNRIAQLQRQAAPAGIIVQADEENGSLRFQSSLGSTCLRLVRLYRPSSSAIEQAHADDVLLVLTAPSRKALQAGANSNYLVLPNGATRIVTDGIVLMLDAPVSTKKESHQVRLMGRTGIVAETLLLHGARRWSVRELAHQSQVSPALAHRVLTRLEQEGLLLTEGSGPDKVRAVRDLRTLAELWSHEEKTPQTVLRGFLYGSSSEAIAQQILAAYPDGAIGTTLAANLYKPTLTRVPLPFRIWVKSDFDPTPLFALGLEKTDEGANIEFVISKDDPWCVHRNEDGLPKVSKARAWLEISEMGGRTQELANALLADLEEQR